MRSPIAHHSSHHASGWFARSWSRWMTSSISPSATAPQGAMPLVTSAALDHWKFSGTLSTQLPLYSMKRLLLRFECVGLDDVLERRDFLAHVLRELHRRARHDIVTVRRRFLHDFG